jgi:hypothetical protein
MAMEPTHSKFLDALALLTLRLRARTCRNSDGLLAGPRVILKTEVWAFASLLVVFELDASFLQL